VSLFDGPGLDPERDDPRLARQIARVYNLMLDGGWWTLHTISAATEAPEASVSARLRDLRKPRFGGHEVEERRVAGSDGLHEYHLVPNEVGLLDGTGVPDEATVWRDYRDGVWCVAHRDFHPRRQTRLPGPWADSACAAADWRDIRIRATRQEMA
jgi:hypothetical protein